MHSSKVKLNNPNMCLQDSIALLPLDYKLTQVLQMRIENSLSIFNYQLSIINYFKYRLNSLTLPPSLLERGWG